MLNLNDLADGLPAITQPFGKVLAEAGGICLESQGHSQGALLQVTGDCHSRYALSWPPVTEQAQRCYNDPEVATEYGAVGLAVLLVKKEIGYEVVERSRRGTGFDYWMGDDSDTPFQNKARLEISGIRCGDKSKVRTRMKQKLRQTNPSDGLLPAYAVIVEFGLPMAEVRRK